MSYTFHIIHLIILRLTHVVYRLSISMLASFQDLLHQNKITQLKFFNAKVIALHHRTTNYDLTLSRYTTLYNHKVHSK